MIFNKFRKLTWPIIKWHITASATRHISNWKLRRAVNVLLVPIYFLRDINLVFSGKFHFPQVGLTITRRCVLNCTDCVALYPFYREQKAGDVPVQELNHAIDRFLDCVDSVHAFGLGGGEPFLHPHLLELLKKVTASPKVVGIRIYSTGMPVPSDDLLQAMANPKVALGISDYGSLSKTMASLLRKLEENAITYRVEKNDWQDFGSFEPRHRNKKDLEQVFSRCWARECMIIINGELHYCYRSAHGMDLGLIPRNESDFVNLLSGDSMEVRNKLKNFVGLEYISACDYCNGARKSVEVRATQHAPGQKATEVAPLEAKVFFAPRQPSGEK